MVLPVSASIQLRRLDTQLLSLRRENNSEEQSVLVSEICNSCILLLDKAMNSLWDCKSKKLSKKPHIYFPICPSREKLKLKLQQYQMPDLISNDRSIFDIIESAQNYEGEGWLSSLHKIASIRHEKFPEIEEVNNSFVVIGRGQNLYIESLTTDAFGNMKFKGHGINRASGKKEAARIDFSREVRSVLKGVGKEPYDLCAESINKTNNILSLIYMEIGKHN